MTVGKNDPLLENMIIGESVHQSKNELLLEKGS